MPRTPRRDGEDRQCTALVRNDRDHGRTKGERCRRWSVVGAKVCAVHGGRIDIVASKAALESFALNMAITAEAVPGALLNILENGKSEVARVQAANVVTTWFKATAPTVQINVSAGDDETGPSAVDMVRDRLAKLAAAVVADRPPAGRFQPPLGAGISDATGFDGSVVDGTVDHPDEPEGPIPLCERAVGASAAHGRATEPPGSLRRSQGLAGSDDDLTADGPAATFAVPTVAVPVAGPPAATSAPPDPVDTTPVDTPQLPYGVLPKPVSRPADLLRMPGRGHWR